MNKSIWKAWKYIFKNILFFSPALNYIISKEWLICHNNCGTVLNQLSCLLTLIFMFVTINHWVPTLQKEISIKKTTTKHFSEYNLAPTHKLGWPALTLYKMYMSNASRSSPASMARMIIHRGTAYGFSGLPHTIGVTTYKKTGSEHTDSINS